METQKYTNKDDKYILGVLINKIRYLLNSADKHHYPNFPLEIAGAISDLLYDVQVENSALVNIVDILAQDVKGKKNKEIKERFELLESSLTKLHSWYE
jgi:hypothetical protein